jgi:hypothetical protein
MVHWACLKSIKFKQSAILNDKSDEMRVALCLSAGLPLSHGLLVLVQNIFAVFEKLPSGLCIDIGPIEFKIIDV